MGSTQSDWTVTGDVSCDDLAVTDDVNIGGDLDVTGGLTIDGASTLTGNVISSGTLENASGIHAYDFLKVRNTASDRATAYSFIDVDGSNPPRVYALQPYNWNTGDFDTTLAWNGSAFVEV